MNSLFDLSKKSSKENFDTLCNRVSDRILWCFSRRLNRRPTRNSIHIRCRIVDKSFRDKHVASLNSIHFEFATVSLASLSLSDSYFKVLRSRFLFLFFVLLRRENRVELSVFTYWFEVKLPGSFCTWSTFLVLQIHAWYLLCDHLEINNII